MRVHKTVEKQGLAKPKATKEDTAIRDAVERLLPLKGYCSFKLADNFESITIGGQAVLQGANLSELDVALALPEALKEAELVTSAEKLVDALLGDTVHEESSKVLAEKLLA